jgi:hypothetical protein
MTDPFNLEHLVTAQQPLFDLAGANTPTAQISTAAVAAKL